MAITIDCSCRDLSLIEDIVRDIKHHTVSKFEFSSSKFSFTLSNRKSYIFQDDNDIDYFDYDFKNSPKSFLVNFFEGMAEGIDSYRREESGEKLYWMNPNIPVYNITQKDLDVLLGKELGCGELEEKRESIKPNIEELRKFRLTKFT
jgi:hypothetical protein